MQERPDALRMQRGLPIPSKILRMLHAGASGHAAPRTGVGPWGKSSFRLERLHISLV